MFCTTITFACAAVPIGGSRYCGPAAISQTRVSVAANARARVVTALVAAATVAMKVRRETSGPLSETAMIAALRSAEPMTVIWGARRGFWTANHYSRPADALNENQRRSRAAAI